MGRLWRLAAVAAAVAVPALGVDCRGRRVLLESELPPGQPGWNIRSAPSSASHPSLAPLAPARLNLGRARLIMTAVWACVPVYSTSADH